MQIRPNWQEIDVQVDDNLTAEEANQAWSGICETWLLAIGKHYDHEYRLDKSAHFFLLSNESERYISIFSAFLERTLQQILSALQNIARDDGLGHHVAIVFADEDYTNPSKHIIYSVGIETHLGKADV